MQVSVKTAHNFFIAGHSREDIFNNIIRSLGGIHPALAVPALETILELPKNMLSPPKIKRMREGGILQQLLGNRCFYQSATELRACVARGILGGVIHPSVLLTVEPTLKVGSLKSLLKRFPWTPEKNLVLLQDKERPIKDDESTLHDCGIRDQDTILVCMGGRFQFTVSHQDYEGDSDGDDIVFPICIKSCFQTVADLKATIHKKTGFPPQRQDLYLQGRELLDDTSLLVTEGIVRPYMDKMVKKLELIVRRRH